VDLSLHADNSLKAFALPLHGANLFLLSFSGGLVLPAVTRISEAHIPNACAPNSVASDVKAWEMGAEHEKTLGWVWCKRMSVSLC